MTEAGQAALARHEDLFQRGQVIPEELRHTASGKVARLAVGLSDSIFKTAGARSAGAGLGYADAASAVP